MSRGDNWSESMRRLIRDYNRPPSPPSEEMWEVISRRLGGEGDLGDGADAAPPSDPAIVEISSRRINPAVTRWLRPSVAAAAILLLGVALGRWSRPTSTVGSNAPGPMAAGEDTRPGRGEATQPRFQALAASYLQDTESFLTLLRADAREGRLDGGLEPWAKGLLLQTRLLLDSPQADEPGVRTLLEDLELVLVQVVQLPLSGGERGREELRWIDEGVEAQQVLPRVQAVIPVGTIMAGT